MSSFDLIKKLTGGALGELHPAHTCKGAYRLRINFTNCVITSTINNHHLCSFIEHRESMNKQ